MTFSHGIRRLAWLGGLALGVAVARPTQAQMLTFEGLAAADNDAVTAPYGGLTWTNFLLRNGPAFFQPGTGYSTVSDATSSQWVVFNGSGQQAELSAGSPFGLVSAVFAAAWEDGLGLTITGYDGTGAVIGGITTSLTVSQAKLVQLNLFGVRRVVFQTTSGTPVFPGVPGTQFAMDNLQLGMPKPPPPTTTVPEPSSVALTAAGAAGLALIARRRRRRR